MKLSKYTLVHSPDRLDAATKLVASVTHPKPGVRRAAVPIAESAPLLTIGLWDLGAWLGGLTRLIEAMNRVQKSFVFFEVKAMVPAGFISRPERVIPWLAKALGRKVSASDKRDIQNNLIANDYFELAECIRKDLKIDYLVGITPSMVAGDNDGKFYWNHFSTFNNRTILASTYEVRELAEKAGCRFEALLAGIIIAQTLVARFYPGIGFHENRGCLFDYNKDRVSIIDKVRDLKIEPECINGIGAPYRPAAQALVDFLRTLGKE